MAVSRKFEAAVNPQPVSETDRIRSARQRSVAWRPWLGAGVTGMAAITPLVGVLSLHSLVRALPDTAYAANISTALAAVCITTAICFMIALVRSWFATQHD